MKLAELTTDRALDVLCELTPSVSNIIKDNEVINALSDAMPKQNDTDTGENDNSFAYGVRFVGEIGSIIPIMLKKHRADAYHILSVLNEKSVKEIARQPIFETMRQARDAFQDSELLSFFKSYMQREQNEQSAPSADSPASV